MIAPSSDPSPRWLGIALIFIVPVMLLSSGSGVVIYLSLSALAALLILGGYRRSVADWRFWLLAAVLCGVHLAILLVVGGAFFKTRYLYAYLPMAIGEYVSVTVLVDALIRRSSKSGVES